MPGRKLAGAFVGMCAGILGLVALGGCASTSGEPPPALTNCDPPQPTPQEVRWLKPASGDVPPTFQTQGVGAAVNKPLALEQGVEVTAEEVRYVPVGEDTNVAMARVAVKRGTERVVLALGRKLPGQVCYASALGLWVGLVDVAPPKAMLRVGTPPPPAGSAPAEEKAEEKTTGKPEEKAPAKPEEKAPAKPEAKPPGKK